MTATALQFVDDAVQDAVLPLNQLLRTLHGPTDSVGETMSRLIAFPSTLRSPADADLLDLSATVTADGRVDVHARCITRTSLRDALAQCVEQYESSPGLCSSVLITQTDDAATVTVASLDGAHHTVTMVDAHGYRSIKIAVSYQMSDLFDAMMFLERFANWHGGCAPVDFIQAREVEVSTFSTGRRSATVALYTTHYRSDASLAETRQMVDRCLATSNLTYTEPRDGILFLDGPIEAEIHLFEEDGESCVNFVGEFQLL